MHFGTQMANAGTFKKGEKRPGQGRPKGSLTRHTVAAKEAIQLAAEGLGGTDRLISWAQEDPLNERAFWASIYPKLLPLTVDGTARLTITWPVAPPAIER